MKCKGIMKCGVVIICIAVLFGKIMELKAAYFLAAILFSILHAPGIYGNYKKREMERKRFNYANAYMTHMAQAFAEHGKILQALRETRSIFTEGEMKKSLLQAICHIENAFDVELAEQEALAEIAQAYDCERIRTLHDFLVRAGQRGGSCAEEFRLLESIRQLWEQNVIKHCRVMAMARNLVVFEYVLLVCVAVFMLKQFPKDLSIIQLPVVQLLNTFLIICMFFLFFRMDRKQSVSLLQDAVRMTEQQAKRKLGYLKRYRKKPLLCQWIEYGRFVLIKWQIKQEIKRVFPCWMFDVLLLLQSENVSVALGKSIEKAPGVMVEELTRMQIELEENPASAEAFLSFFQEFHIPDMEGVMHRLYALNHGTGVGKEVMELMIDTNMKMLAEAEQQRLRLKGDFLSVYYLLPTVPVMFSMIGYALALMYVIFQNVIKLI